MNVQAALNKLYSMHQFSIKLGLERIEYLMDHLDNPQKNLNCFHIAGSNGKGSTASFIASILMEAGFRVGLYTSPHFVRFNERIKINGQEIEDSYIANFVESLEDYINENGVTFFEATTALAFKYFSEAFLDYVILETGLGGRLDATNIIKPMVSVITSISLEHTQILGDTIEKIAVEKAGIIKPKTTVLSGIMPSEAEEIISAKALGSGCRYKKAKDFISIDGDNLNVTMNKKSFKIYSTPLHGSHQNINAALAVGAVFETMGMNHGGILNRGIANVVQNTGIQGRYEILNDNPRIIADSAHNPDGIKSFIREFEKEYTSYSDTVLLFGAMRDKNIGEMINTLTPYFNKIYIAKADNERAASIQEILDQTKQLEHKLIPIVNPAEFVNDFIAGKGNKCLTVLGSMYLVGEIKSKIIHKNP